MGFGHFDQSQMAVIARAIVLADGTVVESDNMSLQGSGAGHATFTSPNPIFSDRDYTIVTILNDPNVSHSVTNGSDVAKTVEFRVAQTGFPVQPDFSIVILRSLTP